MREGWFIKNVHSRELSIADLFRAPAIRPQDNIDLLRYHTKQQIEQSDDLKAAIASGYVTMTKKRDGNRLAKNTAVEIEDAITNVEVNEGLTYFGEMYNDDTDTIITIASTGTYVEVGDGSLGGLSNGLTFQNSKELKVNVPGTYVVHWSMSIHSGTGDELAGAVMKNGVKQNKGTNDAMPPSANKRVSISGHMILLLLTI